MGRRRGIFLITTLFVVMFLTIMGTAVMSEILQGMSSSGAFSDRELALQAAMSGLTYVQARLESNCATLAPSPDGAPLNDDFPTTAFEVQEQGYNIVGVMTNQNVESSGQMRIMFRASFNKQYAKFSQDAVWPPLAAGLPAMPYVSLNCLRVAPGPTFNSYQNGLPLHSVPAEMADVIVQGMVVRSDGTIRATRTAEAMFNLADVPSVNQAPVSSAGNVDLQLTNSGDKVTVTSLAGGAALDGLTSLNNINIVSPDAAGGAAPPDYSSNGKATVPTGQQFNFGAGSLNAATGVVTYSGSPTNYSGNSAVTNLQTVNPPAITSSQLPALSATAVNVPAGTWVEYNNLLYHFPVAFQATNPDGTPMTAEQQPITVVAGVPNYNGIAPSPATGQLSLDGTAATGFNPATNTITISQDVAVQPTAGINSLGIVVAPSSLQTSGNSSAILVSMQPATAGSTVQIRAADAVSVVGNVVGTGDVVIGAVNGTAATVPADVTITGKSATSTASDTAVALYSTGNVNLAAIDPYQPPAGVPSATPMSSTASIQSAIAATYEQNLANGTIPPYPGPSASYGQAYNNGGNLAIVANGDLAGNASYIEGMAVTITINGTTYTNKPLDQVIAAATGQSTSQVDSNMDSYLLAWTGASGTDASITTSGAGFTPVSNPSNLTTTLGMALSDLTNYASTGTDSPGPAPSASPVPAGYSESFNGLVYSYGNFNVFNGNNVTLNGALVTYGGNPNTGAAGSGGATMPGNVNVVGQDMNFVFNPNTVGIFANFFGGEVTLSHAALSVF